MEKVFPRMYSKPEKTTISGLIFCFLLVFIVLPLLKPLMGFTLWKLAWPEICYHIVNGIVLLLFLRKYLAKEWLMVAADVRFYLKHIILTVGLMVGILLVLLRVLHCFDFQIAFMLESLPVVEMSVSYTPLHLVVTEPLFGTITLSVFSPITICALFYCLGFAPVCCKNPWLAYLCIALVTLIPPVVNILWRGDTLFVLTAYIINLPVHLLACWSYQKTDNVWTPIISLGITNLITSILLILLIQ